MERQNTHGVPGPDEEADTASGGAPDAGIDDGADRTDDDGTPVENPSGG